MRTTASILVVAFLFLVATPDVSSAQSSRPRSFVSRWENVVALRPGVTIAVKRFRGRNVKGTFLNVDDVSLMIRRDDLVVQSIDRSDVRRVIQTLRADSQIGRNTAIGAGLGALFLAVSLSAGTLKVDSFFPFVLLGTVGLGAAIGAAAGVWRSRGSHVDVYVAVP